MRMFSTRSPIMFVLAAGIFLLLAARPLAAQDTGSEEGFFVLNQNQVPMKHMSAMRAIHDTTAAPVLDEMVEEGMPRDWGLLTHQWGDEWNFNLYFVTDSHAAFVDFWDEFTRRMEERHPGAFEKMQPMITAHKDNMYTLEGRP